MDNLCPLHSVPFIKHEKDGKTWYSHKNGNEWCNKDKIVKTEIKGHPPAGGLINEWIPVKEKENQSMLRMSALKAASEVVSAYIQRPDGELPKNITELLLDVANRNLMWLKGLESPDQPSGD